jgi:cytochrome c-type biogenesis protein CcmE
MKRPVARVIIGGGLILAGAGYLFFSSMGSSMVYYYTVDEVLSGELDFAERGIRISGWVQPDTVRLTGDGKGVVFQAVNKESGVSMKVNYSGIVPDTFKEDSEVVVEGLWDAGRDEFSASVLLAKCPSKYESRGDSHPEDLSTGKAGPGI